MGRSSLWRTKREICLTYVKRKLHYMLFICSFSLTIGRLESHKSFNNAFPKDHPLIRARSTGPLLSPRPDLTRWFGRAARRDRGDEKCVLRVRGRNVRFASGRANSIASRAIPWRDESASP